VADKQLYLIRHGETDLNKQGIVQGRGMDTDLNERGRMQAEAFYRAYRHVHFDKIYTSSLKRTHQTVQRFIDSGIPWVQYPGLDELAWGVYEGRAGSDETRKAFADIIRNWADGKLHLKFENGESPLDVKTRQLEVLEKIIEQNDDETVLICMHGRAMRLFLCLLMDLPLSEMEQFPHQNTTLYRLRYDGSTFNILNFNNTDHLNYFLQNH
jgi:probable phosphoglycerate mutase